MALKEFEQPEIIDISDSLRLRKYDGHYELFLPGYQNPVVYQNSEGIFDESRIPDLDYVKGMCTYLAKVGELYFIEAKENDDSEFTSILHDSDFYTADSYENYNEDCESYAEVFTTPLGERVVAFGYAGARY